MKKLAQTVRVPFFRTLEINQRLAVSRQQEKQLRRHMDDQKVHENMLNIL